MCWIYASEIPTARLRSLNVAIAAATQWLFNFVVARATPNALVTVGKGGYGYVVLPPHPPSFASVFGWVRLLTAAIVFLDLWLFLLLHVHLRLVLDTRN